MISYPRRKVIIRALKGIAKNRLPPPPPKSYFIHLPIQFINPSTILFLIIELANSN